MANSTPVEEECGSDASSGVLFPLIFQEQLKVELTRIPLPKIKEYDEVNRKFETILVNPLCIKCLPASDSVGIIYKNTKHHNCTELIYGIVDKSGYLLKNLSICRIDILSYNALLSFDITDYGDIFHCNISVKKQFFRQKIDGCSTFQDYGGEVAGVCFVPPNMLLCSIVSNPGSKIIKRDLFTDRTVQIIEKDGTGKNIFKHPGKLCKNKNGDICVTESRSLIVVDNVGLKRFEYKGNGYDDFYPTHVVCDLQKRILISDRGRVHLLNENGVFIMFLVTAVHYGVEKVGCIDIDNQGRLWTIGHGCLLGIEYADSVDAALRKNSRL